MVSWPWPQRMHFRRSVSLRAPLSSALGLLEFLGDGEGMSTATGDKASLELNLKVSEAARVPEGPTSGRPAVTKSSGNV